MKAGGKIEDSLLMVWAGPPPLVELHARNRIAWDVVMAEVCTAD
jgi:hypothetical protein